ncbi:MULTISPECIES: hypothetical protein [Bacillus cereus group]|uniref:hypothetical protein n=1 Tax=Bacillus cereus group TaxID=86661 RepID=UPI0007B6ACE5|nr:MULTISPECIES: hypothetical protein [Bacillus cereus group]ANC08278.1 hypothetical protein WR47_14605 [Bacillus cereus]ANC14099.1 hypothetical protein WR51_14605 [Bacillus cereus]MDA1994765.1 hypothetical protein [Bacillus cereus]MDA2000885.1 hypothetical protein [Bacillus cereus]MDA3654442.1 hypothetical protein [Bacillus cereus]
MDKPLTALQTIIIHMNTTEHWHDFICYCQHREAGLRKLAYKHLETFITNAKKWESKDQEEFAISLFTILDASNEKDEVLTFSLNSFLIDILYRWTENTPFDSRPFRWIGIYMDSSNKEDDLEKSLRKAIELGGDTEQEAMIYLVSNYINTLDFGTHELPSGYCGDLGECIEKLPYMLQLINRIQNKNIKEQNIGQIQEQLHLILDWLKHTQTPVDAIRIRKKEQTKELEKVIVYYLHNSSSR